MNPFYRQKFKVYGIQDTRSEDGGVIYSSYPFIINGKLEAENKVLKGATGEDIGVNAIVFTETMGVLKEQRKIIDTSTNKEYRIISCEDLYNELQYDHTEAYLQLLKY